MKLPPLRINIRLAVLAAGIGLFYLSGATFRTMLSGISRLQDFEACISIIRAVFTCRFHPCFHCNFNSHYFINHHLIFTVMSNVFLSGANADYDTSKAVAAKNQVIRMEGYRYDKYVVYDIRHTKFGVSYRLINLRTHEFEQCEVIRPLSQKFGIGYYFDDENPQFMDAFEVLVLQQEAEYKAKADREDRQSQQECSDRLKAVGRERLQTLIPAGAKAVIVAELHEDDSEPMTDYFGYRSVRTVILGFSTHTKDLFSEMRKYAVNFDETAHLAEVNEKYEHREKYSSGEGYFLGKSKYSGWIVRKERFYGERAQYIEHYALTAGEEADICVKVQKADARIRTTSDTVPGNFLIADYSEKALAIFGDTRAVKDELKALGGRFNPKLTHEGNKRAGWIFSKSKEQQLRNLLTVK